MAMAKKINSLTDIPAKRARAFQQAALMRVQLFITGWLHAQLAALGVEMGKVLANYAGTDGVLDAGEMARAQQEIADLWQKFFMGRWIPTLQGMRSQAASLPFGTLAVYHMQFIKKAEEALENTEAQYEEATYKVSEGVFKPQLQAVIDAANQRVYGDGLNLSSRIWKLDRESRDGINRILMQGASEGKSAWQVAKELEMYLGAGSNCPRWTSTRLYKLTKKDIASGDRRGLKTGDECQGQGVAYNALRMARTEIQAIHHLASDAIAEKMPWIEKDRIVLSPAHPKPDICDDVVTGGDAGDGVYPKGTIRLPLHPHCLCWKESVLMGQDEFVDQLRGWMTGDQSWEAMDAYSDFIGVDSARFMKADFSKNNQALSLLVWLIGDENALTQAAKKAAGLAGVL